MISAQVAAWMCIAAASIGMLAGMVRPPFRHAGPWLAGLYLLGAIGFLLIDGGIALAFFTGLGTWIGPYLTSRSGNRLHFRAGAAGWMSGLAVGLWWISRMG